MGRTSTEELANRYGEIGFQWKHEYEADLVGLRYVHFPDSPYQVPIANHSRRETHAQAKYRRRGAQKGQALASFGRKPPPLVENEHFRI